MKVMMQIRKDIEAYPGGDFLQLLKTREYLHKLGVKVDISHSYKEKLKGYDIVHLFNVTRITDTYLFFHNARNQGRRIVISPIYHSLQDMKNFYNSLYQVLFFNITAYLSLKEIYYEIK